jgi:hypothetical protein
MERHDCFKPFSPCRARTQRRVVASFGTYDDAERAVDLLSDRKFPVERTR